MTSRSGKGDGTKNRAPFKVVVNDHLRRGLDQREAEPIAPFVVVTRPMGLRAGLSLDSASALFDALDSPQAS